MINTGKYNGVHDPLGAEQFFRLAIERIVETMLERQGTRDAMGHRFCIAEILWQSSLSEGAHLVVGQPDVAANSAMGLELVGSLPGRADSQNDDLPVAFTERRALVLCEPNSKNAFEIAGDSKAGLKGPISWPAWVRA